MNQKLNQSLPVQHYSERQDILKQAFLIAKSDDIRCIYETARKICTHKGMALSHSNWKHITR